MTQSEPPRFAVWLLQHFGCSDNNDAVLGDLEERYREGKPPAWYWKQTLIAIVVSTFSTLRGLMLKNCRYGLWMGAFFAPWIVLSQAIFPSNRSDDEAGGLILTVYLATFLYYGTAGFFSVRRTRRVRDGSRIGAACGGLGGLLAPNDWQ